MGYIQNSAETYVTGGSDQVRFKFLDSGFGIRYRPYTREFFFIIPYIESQFTMTYARLRSYYLASGADKLQQWTELGSEFGGGVIFSFLTDAALKNDMETRWSATDFGLAASMRYYASGLSSFGGTHVVKDLSNWDFGLGLHVQW